MCACLTGQLGTAGQRSILDIQKEEAERTRAQREVAEKAAAAAGLPAPSPASGGWAKIAGGGAGTGGNSESVPPRACQKPIEAFRSPSPHALRIAKQKDLCSFCCTYQWARARSCLLLQCACNPVRHAAVLAPQTAQTPWSPPQGTREALAPRHA